MFLPFRRREHGARFVHPIDPAPRTAVLAPGFRENKLIRVFPCGWNESAARFAPTSVAGSAPALRRLTRLGLRLQHAVVVFTYDAHRALPEADRDFFWSVFGVPVFEQYLGASNELLATECDAHVGLHVVEGCRDLPLETEVCPCGNAAPRLMRTSRFAEFEALLA